MYCLNGTTPGVDNQNTNDIVNPLFMLSKQDWWFHHINNVCYPPCSSLISDLIYSVICFPRMKALSSSCLSFHYSVGLQMNLNSPANGQFTVELSVNRAFTTLSYGGQNAGTFLDGSDQAPVPQSGQTCITNPNSAHSLCLMCVLLTGSSTYPKREYGLWNRVCYILSGNYTHPPVPAIVYRT